MASNKENLAIYLLMEALFETGNADKVEKIVRKMVKELEHASKQEDK